MTISALWQALPGEPESERKAGDEGQNRGFGVREGYPRERLEGEGEASRTPEGPRLAPLQQIIRIQWPEQSARAETQPKPLSSPSLSLGMSYDLFPFIMPSFSFLSV